MEWTYLISCGYPTQKCEENACAHVHLHVSVNAGVQNSYALYQAMEERGVTLMSCTEFKHSVSERLVTSSYERRMMFCTIRVLPSTAETGKNIESVERGNVQAVGMFFCQ